MKLKELPLSVYFELKLRILNAKKLNEQKIDSLPVIVSLTSIPSRLNTIHITIRSILNQNHQPKKIILWLNENDAKKIPNSLKKLEGDVFEINFSKIDCPHLKLVESIKNYPNDIIATCDDDFIYDENWLNSLYTSHLKHPKAIIAHRIRQIQYDSSNNLLDYKQWNLTNIGNTKTILAIGSQGVLYPPNSLPKIAIESSLFLKLAPKADDLWFKAMSFIKKTTILQSKNSPKRLIPILGTQKISLKKENVDKNLNLKQWEQLTEYFNLEIE